MNPTRFRLEHCVAAVVLISWFSVPGPSFSQGLGDLMVSPKRVVFEGRQRSARLVLVNQGAETATYRISFVNLRMEDDGRLVEVEEPDAGQRVAESYVRYSPRQVVLAPGASQQVRLLLRRPADLEAGEYRSHLRFAALPPSDAAGTSVEETGEDGGIAVELIPVFGVTIPVLVRHGDLSATVRLADLTAETGAGDVPGEISFRLERQGERSVYGDLAWIFLPDSGASQTLVGVLNGVAVYTPNRSRIVRLPLHAPPGVALEKGTLQVTYAARTESGGGLLAGGRVRLP